MKTLITSVFALSLIGAGAAYADDGIGLGAHVGPIGAGTHVGGDGVGVGAHVGGLGAGVGLHGEHDRYEHDRYYRARYRHCSAWQWRHEARYCRR